MTSNTPRRADDVLGALADAFDHVAPAERPACEEELREAGLDPDAIAARFAALASPARHARSGRAAQPAREARATPSRRRWWAVAAVLVGAIAAALILVRSTPERMARTTPPPRAVVPPSQPLTPPAIEERQDGESAVAGEPRGAATPLGLAPQPLPTESAAETAAIAEAAGQLAALRDQQSMPPIVAAAVRRGTVAVREIAVPARTIAGLQSAAFAAASIGNGGRYAVDPATCGLHGRDDDAPVTERFGYPFPVISQDGRRAGCEIMWNVEAAFAAGGGRRGRAAVCEAAANGEACGDLSFTSLSFVGRPTPPIGNPQSLRAASLLKFEGGRAGAGSFVLHHRPLDGGTTRWFYVPETRRVRRLGPDFLDADAATTGLLFTDSLRNCFDMGPDSYTWTLIGQQDVLAPLSGEGIALADGAEPDDGTPAAGETLTVMRRPAWVVAATDRRAYAGTSRLVLYVDRELYRPYWKTEYVGERAKASYACAAAWASDGDVVAPLTSSVVRFDDEGIPTHRFTPSQEVLDRQVRGDELTIAAGMHGAPPSAPVE